MSDKIKEFMDTEVSRVLGDLEDANRRLAHTVSRWQAARLRAEALEQVVKGLQDALAESLEDGARNEARLRNMEAEVRATCQVLGAQKGETILQAAARVAWGWGRRE